MLSRIIQSQPLVAGCARWATKMQSGITKNNKDSAGRRLGIKKFGGE